VLVGEPVAGSGVTNGGVEHGMVAAREGVVLLEHEPLAAGCGKVLYDGA